MTTLTRPVWRIAPSDRPAALALARGAGVPPIVAQLMLLRGIRTPGEAERFLNPSLSHLFDPFLMTGMREAVARITRARDAGETVTVFGDYDVDGVSATAIMTRGLRRFGVERVFQGMPDRMRDGYGLMPDQVEEAHARGVSLLITVDNGINAFAAVDRARELGVDLIVTDHHSVEDRLPEVVAVLNPRIEPEGHPARGLCGAGVALKLATALNGTPNDLDIAALGTVADIVPLSGENRAIVALGLKHMKRHARTGLAQLADVAGFSLAEVTSEKIGFQLGPRLNAAGRLDDARVALDLLMAECPEEAKGLAGALNTANSERRAIEQEIFNEAAEELDAFFNRGQRSIVVAREGWHQGVIGIVAARLLSRYHRPVVVFSVSDGVAKGSARAMRDFDLMEALTACRHHLDKYGGHRAAAGMTMKADRLAAFREDFERAARAQGGDGEPLQELDIDARITFGEIDAALLKNLERLEPFGQGNPAPLFAALGVEVVPQSVRVLKEQHVKMTLRQGDTVFTAVWFRMAERFLTEPLPALVDAAFTPQPSNFAMDTPIRLIVRDMRPAGT